MQQQNTPQFGRLMRLLMDSSEYGPEDFYNRPLLVIRESVFRISSIILMCTSGGSIIYISQSGMFALAVIKSVVCAILVFHNWRFFKYNRPFVQPRDIILFGLISLIVSVLADFHEGILWGFAFPVASYLLAEKRDAIALNIAGWVVCTVLALSVMPIKFALIYSVSFISVCFLVEILCSILYRNEEHLKQLAVRDPLTGAYNRRAMEDEMEQAVMLCKRYKNPAAVIVIDMDKFKDINDNFGHKEGDKVLVNLVALVSERIRSTDKLYRFGGEEFVVILAETNGEQALRVAQSLCELVRDGQLSAKTRVTISCGVTQCRENDTVREWMHRGDMALYRAKSSGRDRALLE